MPTADANEALERIRCRQPAYSLYADYYEGRHRLNFATDKFRNAFGRLFRALSLNHCPAVVQAVADRLELTSFGTEKGQADAAKRAWELWNANRMDLVAGQVHQETLGAGDGYVIVWPRPSAPQEPVIYPQEARLVTVVYDDEDPGRMLWAAKAWTTKVRGEKGRYQIRLNLYYPDRIEKYVSPPQMEECLPEKADAFQRFEVPGEPWPLPNPYDRPPVFHFANAGSIGQCGVSELRNIIPVQDALNKAVCDLLVGMEYVAFPQRWVTGLEPDIDESTGKPKLPFTPGVDRLWTADAEGAAFGQFEQASLEGFLKVQDSFRLEIARISGTPPHYMALITDPPSGEALKTLEARFVKKCKRRQTAFGNTWEDVMAFALQVAGETAEVRLSATWVDPAPKSEKEHAETIAIKQGIGVDLLTALQELGYTEAEAQQIMKRRQAEQRQQRALGSALLQDFERGKDGEEPAAGA